MSSAPPTEPVQGTTLQILSIVCFSFIGFMSVGIPMAVLPGLIHHDLGFSTLVAGLVIGLQYLVTLLVRPFSCRVIDSAGPKQALIYGLTGCALGGLLMLLATLWLALPLFSLLVLVLSRLVLGMAHSVLGASAIAWGIGQVGSAGTARVISWNGIASYGAIGLGAPLGVWLAGRFGLPWMGASVLLIALCGLALAWRKTGVPVVAGDRLSFMSVLGRVGPYGLAMALGTLGYGTIAAFITLYYDSRGWAWAEYAMTAFGFSFIAARLLFAQAIDRLGGYRVGIACLLVEGGGLLLLWAAPGPLLAMLGAGLSGFGFSLVFPALGVEAVKSTPASNRGAAIGAYSLFLDLALGVAGPLIGLLIGSQGFRSIFLVCALAAFCGLGLTLALQQRSARQPAGSAAELAPVEAD
ncbi:Predicted arabinose efflux permease, MFS family [Azotobacter beijerinckii]|uniref:Uncharacterized MFS-type transporter SAMN04244573_00170 n=1 Tax=Azotobacter beijerinckii TaxID=170623 RepID=A0A1H8Z9X6_9GAMM|nr:MFS transporter [Azotobacter beijerinckii]SEP61057.1 Predicted arabinose efflux permease, MFS family [Azotobacter beijerinckii]